MGPFLFYAIEKIMKQNYEEFKYVGNYMLVSEELIEDNVWERCYLRDGIIIYAIDEEDRFIMIEEKRPHEDSPVRLRFVSGHMEPDITILECANKELREEIGLRALELEIFHEVIHSGTINNKVSMVVAKKFVPDPLPNPDGNVILTIKHYTKNEIIELIKNDQLPWSQAVLGFIKLNHLLYKNIF